MKTKTYLRMMSLILAFIIVLCGSFVYSFAEAKNMQDNRSLLTNKQLVEINEQIHLFDSVIDSNGKTLAVGEGIACYESCPNGIVQSSIYVYPIFSDGAIILCAISNGSIITITQELAHELNRYIGKDIALVYDKNTCYCVLEHSVHPLVNTSETVNHRTEYVYDRGQVFALSTIRPVIRMPVQSGNRSQIVLAAPYVSQHITESSTSKICWAASVASIGNYLTNYSYTAKYVAQTVAGSTNVSDWNVVRTFPEMKSALQSIYSVSYPYYSASVAPTNSRIYTNMYSGYPMIGGWQSSGGSLHATVIRGYSSNNYILIMDPNFGYTTAYNTSGVYSYFSSSSQNTLTLIGYLSKL